MLVQRFPHRLKGNQCINVEPGWVGQCATCVARSDKEGAFLGKKACRVFANSAEPLHGDSGSFQIEVDEFAGDVDASRKTEAGRADLIKRNSTEGTGKPTARPISSLTHAMHCSSVPMSGPGM